MSNAPDVETQAAQILNQRFFLHSEELIRTQDFDDPHTLGGRFIRGPFANMGMHFEFENLADESLTVEILASFDFAQRNRQIGVTGGNREVTEVDAVTTWGSISTDAVVPGGRLRRTVDWPALANARSPDALRLQISSGDGTMLVDVHQGYI